VGSTGPERLDLFLLVRLLEEVEGAKDNEASEEVEVEELSDCTVDSSTGAVDILYCSV